MIPLVKPIFGPEEKKLVNEVIDTGIIASGKYVAEFEKKCAEQFETKFAIATSNGTTALHTALLAAGVKRGDTVLTTPFSFIATANSILYCGAKPVFADIDPKTFNLDADAAEEVLKRNPSIRAVIPVHLYGHPCDMDKFARLCEKYGIFLIEDCAQAHGAKYKGKNVGSFSKAGCFSYYATKNVTSGEGGMITTDDINIERISRQIINHGRGEHSVHEILGYNYRLTNIAAAIGISQMNRLNEWVNKRRLNAAFLDKNLSGLTFLDTPYVSDECEHAYHQYTVRVKKQERQRLISHLSEQGVGCGIYYPSAIYNQPLYQKLGLKNATCFEAEKAAEEVLSLPVHPALTKDELNKIVSAVKSFK